MLKVPGMSRRSPCGLAGYESDSMMHTVTRNIMNLLDIHVKARLKKKLVDGFPVPYFSETEFIFWKKNYQWISLTSFLKKKFLLFPSIDNPRLTN